MLNTDLHNEQVKVKMTKEQFVANTRGIAGGCAPHLSIPPLPPTLSRTEFPEEFLRDLYHRIKHDEIKLTSDQLVQSPSFSLSLFFSTTGSFLSLQGLCH
jgi:Sec7-like guanine-nucleotide exchange factor